MLNSGVHDSRVWDSQMQLLTTVPDGSNQVGMFTEKTVKIMPKIHIDLVNKVLDMVCTIYNAGADRYLMTENKVDESATEKLMSIYNGFNAAKLIPLNAFDGLPVKVYKLYCVYILPFDTENLGYGISLKYLMNCCLSSLMPCFSIL